MIDCMVYNAIFLNHFNCIAAASATIGAFAGVLFTRNSRIILSKPHAAFPIVLLNSNF